MKKLDSYSIGSERSSLNSMTIKSVIRDFGFTKLDMKNYVVPVKLKDSTRMVPAISMLML